MTSDELLLRCAQHGITVSITGFVREHDAAQLLGVCPRTLRSWRVDKRGPRAVRLGPGWRYAVDELAAALTPLAESGNERQKVERLDSDNAADRADDAPQLQPTSFETINEPEPA